MSDQKRIDQPTGTETVGHEWDGIEELNTPLPRWWLWTFYATIAWSLVYVVLFPAWPLVERATAGTLGWTSRGVYAADVAKVERERAPIYAAIAQTPIEQLPANRQLMRAAVAGGGSAFRVYCVQCHGSGAAGSKGYPNLNDDDWLWGGDLKTIEYTLTHGIRNPGHPQTRMSQMPAFGRDGILQPNEIDDVVSYVRSLSRLEGVSPAAQRGATLFAANCAVCHGANGEGMRNVGAPSLRDAIWLYGSDRDDVRNSVHNSRQGVMPRFGDRLDPVTIRMLATYVHSRGGGEATPAIAAASAAAGAAVAAPRSGAPTAASEAPAPDASPQPTSGPRAAEPQPTPPPRSAAQVIGK